MSSPPLSLQARLGDMACLPPSPPPRSPLFPPPPPQVLSWLSKSLQLLSLLLQHGGQMEAFLDDGGVMSLCLHLAKYPTIHAHLPPTCARDCSRLPCCIASPAVAPPAPERTQCGRAALPAAASLPAPPCAASAGTAPRTSACPSSSPAAACPPSAATLRTLWTARWWSCSLTLSTTARCAPWLPPRQRRCTVGCR